MKSALDRRWFGWWLTLLGGVAAAEGTSKQPESFTLPRNGWMPNHPVLPVLVYRSELDLSAGNQAERFEALLTRNGWPPQWRNGIYPFHHYHSTAHEVLAVAQGWAKVVLGGEGARKVDLKAGDVAVLPAGTGHCRVDASSDFLVIGAYPPDQQWDLQRTAPDEPMLRRIRELPFPASDPVRGASGPLTRLWQKS